MPPALHQRNSTSNANVLCAKIAIFSLLFRSVPLVGNNRANESAPNLLAVRSRAIFLKRMKVDVPLRSRVKVILYVRSLCIKD